MFFLFWKYSVIELFIEDRLDFKLTFYFIIWLNVFHQVRFIALININPVLSIASPSMNFNKIQKEKLPIAEHWTCRRTNLYGSFQQRKRCFEKNNRINSIHSEKTWKSICKMVLTCSNEKFLSRFLFFCMLGTFEPPAICFCPEIEHGKLVSIRLNYRRLKTIHIITISDWWIRMKLRPQRKPLFHKIKWKNEFGNQSAGGVVNSAKSFDK